MIDLMLVQLLNSRLCKCWFDTCTIVDAIIIKKFILFYSRDKHYKHQHKSFFRKAFSKYIFQCFTHWYSYKYSKGDGLTKQNLNFKGAFSGLRQFLANESPLKMIENTFYFTLKAFFVLKIFKFLS